MWRWCRQVRGRIFGGHDRHAVTCAGVATAALTIGRAAPGEVPSPSKYKKKQTHNRDGTCARQDSGCSTSLESERPLLGLSSAVRSWPIAVGSQSLLPTQSGRSLVAGTGQERTSILVLFGSLPDYF